MTDVEFKIEIINPSNIEIIIPLLQQLNNTISEDVLKARLSEMVKNNYRCIGVFEKKKLIAISGVWVLHKYYIGKHIEPDNVIVDSNYRGKRIGEMLSKWIDDFAKQEECLGTELNAYVTNSSGVRFWLNQGYKIIGFHFQKKYS